MIKQLKSQIAVLIGKMNFNFAHRGARCSGKEKMVVEHNFNSSHEFVRWKSDKEIYNIEYLGTLSGKKSQVYFEVHINNDDSQLVCININANELFFISKEELNDWFIANQAREIINNGYSDIFSGFNEFCCRTAKGNYICMVDSTALL